MRNVHTLVYRQLIQILWVLIFRFSTNMYSYITPQINIRMSCYKRKSERKLVFTETLIKEVKIKLKNDQSKPTITRELNIPEATLRKRLRNNTIPLSLLYSFNLGERKRVG